MEELDTKSRHILRTPGDDEGQPGGEAWLKANINPEEALPAAGEAGALVLAAVEAESVHALAARSRRADNERCQLNIRPHQLSSGAVWR